MNFCSAFPRSQLVTLNDRQIDNSLFVAEVCASLDKNIPFNITQASIAVTVITARFRGKEKGNKKSKHGEKYCYLFHFSSFPDYL